MLEENQPGEVEQPEEDMAGSEDIEEHKKALAEENVKAENYL